MVSYLELAGYLGNLRYDEVRRVLDICSNQGLTSGLMLSRKSVSEKQKDSLKELLTAERWREVFKDCNQKLISFFSQS